MANRQNAIECARQKEKENQTQLHVDDEFVISIDKSSYSGHYMASLDFNIVRLQFTTLRVLVFAQDISSF
jgi:hypothetical protein